jgi:acyl carrier protein
VEAVIRHRGRSGRLLTFDDFAIRICALLGVESASAVLEHTSLFDELGLDSLQGLQLILVVEGLADIHVPPADLPLLLTMGDAYKYFCSLSVAHE